MLFYMRYSDLCGIRLFDKQGTVILSTGGWIEVRSIRNDPNYRLAIIELSDGERIIGVRSYDIKWGFSSNKNF